jgi:hypothetical protein
MIGVPLEGFEVSGAITAVEIVTHCQRNGDMGHLRSVGCRKHKRDDSKDGGEREMHLSRQAELEDGRVRRERTGVNLKCGLWLRYSALSWAGVYGHQWVDFYFTYEVRTRFITGLPRLLDYRVTDLLRGSQTTSILSILAADSKIDSGADSQESGSDSPCRFSSQNPILVLR